MSEKARLDVYLVNKGLAQSRTHAQELIEANQVYYIENGQRKILKKASLSVDMRMDIRVANGPANRFVSRGGLKLEGALNSTKLNIQKWKVMDIGISTGGFTDCLLQKGAEFVLGVDVGHGQVHPNLLRDPRLKVIEGVNARNLSNHEEVQQTTPPQKFDLIVMDVSFISITLIIPEAVSFLKPEGYFLSLVKPQFEVGIEGLSKGGIVKNVDLYEKVEKKIKGSCTTYGLQIQDYFSSAIQGKDGNNEFFILAKKV